MSRSAPTFAFGLTDHLEGPADRPSAEVFAEVGDLVRLADNLGAGYFWFAEHHTHAHLGHMPCPLLYALHWAGQTRSIRLGTAILCLNLRHPLDAAEQVAVADTLAGGRLAVGFGSGSTPAEFALFDRPVTDDAERHARFRAALAAIRNAWSGTSTPRLLPTPAPDLAKRTWLAVNSAASAQIAGAMGFNVLFSHLRTPEDYRGYTLAYREAGGAGLIAANRPVFVGPDDATAWRLAEPALRALWRRFRADGKIPAATPEPTDPRDLVGHPINFVVGGPATVAQALASLHAEAPFDVANLEVRWPGLTHDEVRMSLRLLLTEVAPRFAPQGSPTSVRAGPLVEPMEPIHTGRHQGRIEGRLVSAEIEARFRPYDSGEPRVSVSGTVRRFLNATFGADPTSPDQAIWDAIRQVIRANEKCLRRWPGIRATTFRSQIDAIRLSPASITVEVVPLLAEAARKAAEAYFAGVLADPVPPEPPDPERPFTYRPEAGFYEEFLARRPSFLEYAAESRPNHLDYLGVLRLSTIETARRERCLTPSGNSYLGQAVHLYLLGCRPEAEDCLAQSIERLELADVIDEKAAGDYGSGWGLGQRYAALAFGRWLATGEPQTDAIERARHHFLVYYRRVKDFDRATASYVAPELLFLGADEVLRALAGRLGIDPTGADAPRTLFGDALRLAHLAGAERDHLLTRLRRRLPLHLFRWINSGQYTNAAFVLYALFPHPDGPPSRVIEAAWDVLPEIERRRELRYGWDVVKSGGRTTGQVQGPNGS